PKPRSGARARSVFSFLVLAGPDVLLDARERIRRPDEVPVLVLGFDAQAFVLERELLDVRERELLLFVGLRVRARPGRLEVHAVGQQLHRAHARILAVVGPPLAAEDPQEASTTTN